LEHISHFSLSGIVEIGKKSGLTMWCKNHARPNNNNTAYDYQEKQRDCQDLSGEKYFTVVQGRKQGKDGSRYIRRRWRGNLDHDGCPIELRVNHGDVICSLSRDVGVSGTAADPLVIDPLVGIEGAICWNRFFSPGNRLHRDLPPGRLPETIFWFRGGDEDAPIKCEQVSGFCLHSSGSTDSILPVSKV
jgi:hypothetical protein